MTWPLVICASGPSLPAAAAKLARCRARIRCIAVNDAIDQVPWADVLLGSDASWWEFHRDRLRCYAGTRIMPARYPVPHPPARVTVLQSAETEPPRFIPFNAGQCSGFAAISYVLTHWPPYEFVGAYKVPERVGGVSGGLRIVLVGYDMRIVDGKRHFFGDHPAGLRNTDPAQFVPDFERAAELLGKRYPIGNRFEILNATPNSALRCFPFVNLEDV